MVHINNSGSDYLIYVVGGALPYLQQTPSKQILLRFVLSIQAKEVRPKIFYDRPNLLLNDPEINVIVEVINETEPAQIVSTALKTARMGERQ
jgi:homoserine dehydrogenase